MAAVVEAGFPVVVPATAQNVNLSQSITVGAGANRLLLVMVAIEDVAVSVASGTFNAVALTKLGSFATATFAKVECWYLIAPASVTGNVVMVPTGGASATHWAAAIYVLDDAHQTTPLRTAVGAGATGTSSTHTVAGFTSGDYVLDVESIDSTGHTPTPGTSQTADFATQNMGAGTNEWRCSHKTADGTMAWSWTTSSPSAHLATAVVAATAGGLSVSPASLGSAAAFGTVTATQTVHPASLASAGAFGTIKANQTIYVGSVPSAGAFGAVTATQTVHPAGLVSAGAFGAVIAGTGLQAFPASLLSAAQFGLVTVTRGGANLALDRRQRNRRQTGSIRV